MSAAEDWAEAVHSIRAVARAEIMPPFRRLAPGGVQALRSAFED